jgi:hypothetical protein
MPVVQIIKDTKPWVWKVIGGLASTAALLVSLTQLSDYYWDKVDTLVKGSVTQSTLKVTAELRKTERSIGGFLVDDIKFRIVGVQDEIAVFVRKGEKVPLYLNRQLDLLKDQLEEAKEKWKE